MRVWSRDSKTGRWHLSAFRLREGTVPVDLATALEAAIPNASGKVRWWLVEDDRYGHLYEFRNDGGRFTPLNWPATKEAT